MFRAARIDALSGATFGAGVVNLFIFVVVHLYGMPVQMDEIINFAKKA